MLRRTVFLDAENVHFVLYNYVKVSVKPRRQQLALAPETSNVKVCQLYAEKHINKKRKRAKCLTRSHVICPVTVLSFALCSRPGSSFEIQQAFGCY